MLVIIVILIIGSVIIAYLIPFSGEPRMPLATIQGRPTAYKKDSNVVVELVIVNTGNVPLRIKGEATTLKIVNTYIGQATLEYYVVVYPGKPKILNFTFVGAGNALKEYATATGIFRDS